MLNLCGHAAWTCPDLTDLCHPPVSPADENSLCVFILTRVCETLTEEKGNPESIQGKGREDQPGVSSNTHTHTHITYDLCVDQI